MRLNRQQVIERLKAGEVLKDDGINSYFEDGGHCNINTFWWLRDNNLISQKEEYMKPSGNTLNWHWNK